MSGSSVFFPSKKNKVMFTTPGAASFVVPSSVNEIRVTLVGGGASGGKSSTSTGGHGGGGGACKELILNVNPGETLSLNIGAGGTAPVSIGPGVDGQNTTISGSFGTIRARGGYGGGNRADNLTNSVLPRYQGEAGAITDIPLIFLRNVGAGIGGIGGNNGNIVVGGVGEDGLYGIGGTGIGQAGGGGGSYGNGGNALSPNSASGTFGGGGGGALGTGTAGNGGNGLIIIRYGSVDKI